MNMRKIAAMVLIPIGGFIFTGGASIPPAEASCPCCPCGTPPPCQYYYCGGPGGVSCFLGNSAAGSEANCTDDAHCVHSGDCDGNGHCVAWDSSDASGLCTAIIPSQDTCYCQGTAGAGTSSYACWYQGGQDNPPGTHCTLHKINY